MDGAENVLPLAKKESWMVIDMKNNWKRVFPPNKK